MEDVKQELIAFMAQQGLDVGHVLPEKPFYFQRAIHWPPPKLDALEPALDSFVTEGTLERRNNGYFLTQAGFDRLYPEGVAAAVAFVKADIRDFLRRMNCREGHALPVRPFNFQRVMHYSPLQKRALDDALASLLTEGVLEERNGSYILTQQGYAGLY